MTMLTAMMMMMMMMIIIIIIIIIIIQSLHKSVCMWKKKRCKRAVMYEVGSLNIANFIYQLTTTFLTKGMVAVRHNYTSQWFNVHCAACCGFNQKHPSGTIEVLTLKLLTQSTLKFQVAELPTLEKRVCLRTRMRRNKNRTIYRGADKSLARPGRKKFRKHVRDARDFNNIETRVFIKFFFSARKGV